MIYAGIACQLMLFRDVRGLLRLADGDNASQISEWVGAGARARSQKRESSHYLQDLVLGGFFFPRFVFSAFAATISYDCRIKPCSSSSRSALSRSSITHL